MTGEILGAPALMEEDAGFVTTEAEGEGGDVVLVGRKALVPWPGRAALYVVRARRGEDVILVLVESGAAGLTHERGGPDLGLLGYETGDLVLAKTPGVVLGDASLLERVWGGARIAVSALLCGLARGALDHALRYAGERKQFGKELRQFTAMQERLCRIDTLSASLRGLVHGAARLRDLGEPHAHAARRARLFATEVAMQSVHDAVQVYGGAGYSREYPIERYFRDAGFPGFGEHVPHIELADSTEALAR
jgi:alkylation response protein AidB-like acyl-CoA dehydrogenase